MLAGAARAKGALADAVATLEKAAARFGDPLSLANLGMTYALAGRRSDAQNALHRLEGGGATRRVPSIFPAFIYAGLSEKQTAIEHLEKAFEEHDAFVLWLGVSPDWDPLRGEPRFEELAGRLRPGSRPA